MLIVLHHVLQLFAVSLIVVKVLRSLYPGFDSTTQLCVLIVFVEVIGNSRLVISKLNIIHGTCRPFLNLRLASVLVNLQHESSSLLEVA